MPSPRTLTNDQLKERLELCREFGVSSYEETAEGVKFTLGARVVEVPVHAEVLTQVERDARRAAEVRRITLAHNPTAQSRPR